LKNGNDFLLSNGKTISNSELTFKPKKSYSYAFCSDTAYKPDIIPIIKNVDILYHESTFLNELKELAIKTGHSTALEAATIAKKAAVGELILGHFSNRYTNYDVFLQEAKTVFSNTIIPEVLKTYST
jgi:ribonuclease Z